MTIRPREEAEPSPERAPEQFPGPMVITASGEMIILMIVIGALFTAAMVWIARPDRGLYELIIIWTIVFLFGAFTFQGLCLLIPGRAGMILDRDGLTIIHGFLRWKHRWSDISDITTYQFRRTGCVVFNDRTSTSIYSRLNRALSGHNGYVPPVLSVLDQQDMKRLLESWRARAMAEQAR